jgi:8-oxo-dGTP pyrophosphatase MutT (NUDIX family)
MWLITNFGFFSIVRKPEDVASKTLTVRGRVRADLELLRTRYLPNLGPISADAGTDYKYRATAPKADVAKALRHAAEDIDYSNFKDSVSQTQGPKRAHLYHGLWDILYELQEDEAIQQTTSKVDAEPLRASAYDRLGSRSYGGVLVDEEERVLLRMPAGQFDGYVWTFPKGRGHEEESPEETALREVLEETGYRAEVVCAVPGSFAGGTGATEYFLMRPLGGQGPYDRAETEDVRWVPLAQAATYIEQTRNMIGRRRDFAVLSAAIVEHRMAKGTKR